MIKVKRFNNVINQFIIRTDKGVYFQSYDTIIAFRPNDGSPIQLDNNNWNYSKTTGKYRNIFLNEDKRETEKKIFNGTYILTELN